MNQKAKNMYNRILLEELLRSKKAGDILKAAKSLQRDYVIGLESVILEILKKRYNSGKSWEIQVELIKIIGRQKIITALPFLEHIVTKNVEHDMVTCEAASAYFRLMRRDLTDVSPIINRYNTMGYSLGEGFLNVLGEDDMLPSRSNQDSIISHFWSFGDDRAKGFLDPRYGLIKACLNWDASLVPSFLEFCKKSTDHRVQMLLNK